MIIEDDVEIGANCTVDRGALDDTKIGRGTKIDNLVQIGHNVIIGEHCIIIAQNGIGGSSDRAYSILAGQAGGGTRKLALRALSPPSQCHQRSRGQPTIHGLPGHPRLGPSARSLPSRTARLAKRELEKRLDLQLTKPSDEA